jgi:hypothetical protein
VSREIWLPLEACQEFEKAFGLTYDNATELYLVNGDLHSRLLAENANVTFTLAQKLQGGQTIDIVLPYAAFDLVALPPYRTLNESSSYFPLRRAANETQYTLGRTFLQESYLVVDWERFNFSVYQASWTLGGSQQLVPIISPTLTNETNPASSTQNNSSAGHLSTGGIIGLAIGIGLTVALVAFGAVWWFWRKRHAANKKALLDAAAASAAAIKRVPSEKSESNTLTSPSSPPANESSVFPKAELPADSAVRHEMNGFYGPNKPEDAASSSAASPSAEANSNERKVYEMMGDVPTPLEADGRQLSEKESMMVRERRYNGAPPEETPNLTVPEETHRRLAPVTADDIAVVDRRGLQNVSPTTPRTPRDGTYLEVDDTIMSPLSPMGNSQTCLTDDSGTSRRRFSFEPPVEPPA